MPNPTNPVMAGPCVGRKIKLNKTGLMVRSTWLDIPKYYDNVNLDTFIVMSNHIHGILIITNNGRAQGPAPTKLSLSDIIGRFKSLTTHYRNLTNYSKLWQRSFYDRIIRHNYEWYFINEYITDNPVNWERDEYFQ